MYIYVYIYIVYVCIGYFCKKISLLIYFSNVNQRNSK